MDREGKKNERKGRYSKVKKTKREKRKLIRIKYGDGR